MNTWNTFDRTQPLANPPRCVLENVSWEEVIGRDNIQAFSPFSGVAIGASNGCHLCSLLYGALKTFDPFEGCTRLRSDCSCLSRANIPFHLAGRDNYVVVDVDCTSLSGANHRAILQLSTLPHNRGMPLDYQIELRDISNRRRDGPEMVGLELDGLARAWIQDCERTHNNCPKREDGIFPTRVLDVRGESLDSIHLTIPAAGTRGKWTALSYCWGDIDQTHQTTTRNLNNYLRHIQFSKLPRTIRDAILVTRSLGIPYLWVDALCIIQDSQSDWRAEAPKMMNVYRNAYLTIAANVGSHADSGLAIDRNVLESRPDELRFREPDGKRLVKYRWIHPPRQPWERIMSLATLQTRGWTLQETHLASRVIYYDKRGLYWQCREGVRQERVPAYLIMANDLVVPRRRIFDSYSDDPMNIFVLWGDLVQEFTRRKLSYESDKLFALAGIASAMASYIKSRAHRRLATPEEKEMYSAPRLRKHWAVPDNPEAIGSQRFDGANASIRWILSTPGGIGALYMGGPMSMDPWLGMRFARQLDPEAERAFARPDARTREIMKSEGMELLLKFVDDLDNPDYDDEYVHLMSHPDTHAAYIRAYAIWMMEHYGSEGQSQDGVDGTNSAGQSPSFEQEATESSEPLQSTAGAEQLVRAKASEPEVQGSNNIEEQESDEDHPVSRPVTPVDRDKLNPLPEQVQKDLAAVQDGVHLDPDIEIEPPVTQGSAIYVYHDDDPVKARVEWPAFVSDGTYLAGIWKADLINQLQWRCKTPGTRPAKYRAPSWSWASMDNATVSYDNQNQYTRSEGCSYTRLPRLLDARVVHWGHNDFGDASSARLVLLADIRDMPFHVEFGQDMPTSYWQDGPDKKSNPDSGMLADRGYPDMFPGNDSNLMLDEDGQRPGPMLKILRLTNNFCLVVDLVDMSQVPLFAKRVGCWWCSSGSFADYNAEKEKGMMNWESRTVVLV